MFQCFRLLHTTEAIIICRPSYSFITINGSTASIYYNLRFGILLLNILVCLLLTALCFVYLAEACVQFPVTDHYSSNYYHNTIYVPEEEVCNKISVERIYQFDIHILLCCFLYCLCFIHSGPRQPLKTTPDL